MNKKAKLQELYKKLESLQNKEVLPSNVDSIIKDQVLSFAAELKNNPTLKVLKKFSSEFDKFKEDFDLKPITELIREVEAEIKENIKENQESLSTDFESKLGARVQEVKNLIPKLPEPPKPFDPSPIVKDISSLREDLLNIKDFDPIPLQTDIDGVRQRIETLEKQLEDNTTTEELRKDLEKKIAELRADLMNRINNKGGGNMNRNIAIGGNTSVLSMYTDVNLKAGSNVTITYARNNTTKYTDVTIASSGGGGSVGGVIRSIETVSTSQTMGNTAGTDYVYLASAGIQLVLPTPVSNTNLYTVKNVSNSSILIVGTIDDDVNGVIMPVKYTSVDIISNDTDWDIT